MPINAAQLYQQFVKGFEQYGSSYAPDFPEMNDPSRLELPAKSQFESPSYLPSAKWLPAVVAASLGMSPKAIGNLLHRYGAQPIEFEKLSWNKAIGDYQEKTPEGWNIAARILDGFETKSVYQYELGKFQHPVVQYALLHSENEAHWSVSRIDRLSQLFKLGKATNEDFQNLENKDLFVTSHLAPRHPNLSPVDFVTRSGLLHPEFIKKKFDLNEAWEVMFNDWYVNSKRWDETVVYCIKNLVGEPREAMVRAIQTMTPSISYNADNQSVGYFYEDIKRKVSELGAAEIFNSVIMKLNFMPSVEMKDRLYIKETFSFDDLLDSPEKVLGQVAKELGSINPDEFALGHFTAFHQIKTLWRVDQDCSGFDPNAFALKVLKAYEAFSTPEGVYATEEKLLVDSYARQGVQSLISLLLPQHDFDHSVFKELESRSVAILAKAGLDKSRLPRMNAHDLGSVFSEDLGL